MRPSSPPSVSSLPLPLLSAVAQQGASCPLKDPSRRPTTAPGLHCPEAASRHGSWAAAEAQEFARCAVPRCAALQVAPNVPPVGKSYGERQCCGGPQEALKWLLKMQSAPQVGTARWAARLVLPGRQPSLVLR